jgi:hypothetical protein
MAFCQSIIALVAELTGRRALLAEGVLTEMLVSVDRLTKYQAKLA